MGLKARIRRSLKAEYHRRNGHFLPGTGMARQAKRDGAHRLTQTFFPPKSSRQQDRRANWPAVKRTRKFMALLRSGKPLQP